MNLIDDKRTPGPSKVAERSADCDVGLDPASRPQSNLPTFLNEAAAEPWRFDFFNMMRRLERSFPDRPRIGDSAASREDVVSLGQDPFMDFPASNLTRVEQTDSGRVRVFAKFLGLLGPQG